MFDHRVEPLTGRGQPIDDLVPLIMALHDAGARQLMQPLGEQARRHLWNTAGDVIEMTAAEKEFADHEHCPAPDRVAALDQDLVDLARRFDVGTDSTVLDWEYLLFITHKVD